MGHEFLGIDGVVGTDAQAIKASDVVVLPVRKDETLMPSLRIPGRRMIEKENSSRQHGLATNSVRSAVQRSCS